MADPAKRHATYEDVLRAPAHQVAEVIAGELHLHPRPAAPHAVRAEPFDAIELELGILWADVKLDAR